MHDSIQKESIQFNFSETSEKAGNMPKTWQEREFQNRESWTNVMEDVKTKYFDSLPLPQNKMCDRCQHGLILQGIKCLTCCEFFCWSCGQLTHSRNPFHHRVYLNENTMQSVPPQMFYDINWCAVNIGACICLFNRLH